ncbi:MAG: hypothetical protein HYS60_02800 [Candidatus Wildermuthbacteria bacterium]|nr:hypothetical protein [Candidatus Wildermuthbacteria bacterium]
MKQSIIPILVIGAAAVGFIWVVGFKDQPASVLDGFAQCLAQKGATMYGADWCSHCQNEKKAFGASFRFVPYVECPDNPQQCLKENIQGYPTWIFPDGKRLEGEQGIQKLSLESGCALQQ